jgi:predicted RNase H-like nuclease (RuvC/YqgF family)
VSQKEPQELKKRLQQSEDRNNVLEEELRVLRHKWAMLFQSKSTREARSELLKIRCTEKTKQTFKAFVIDGNFETQEDGLSWLLQKYSDQTFERGMIHIAH